MSSQNWSQRKKYLMLGILSLAAFTSHCAAIGNQQGISAQADLYHKSLNDMADTVLSIPLLLKMEPDVL